MSKEPSIWILRGGALYPVNERAEELLRLTTKGTALIGNLRSLAPRSLRQLRLYWGLMQILVDHEMFPNRVAASDVIKIASGHCEMRVNPDGGEIHLIPKSIAIENLERPDFNKLFDSIIDVIVRRYLEVAPDDLKDAVFAALDGPEKTALGRRV